MAQIRANGPYIWVTWLTKLLVGENSCEWAAWFISQHESWSWDKVASTFDQAAWQMEHTAKLNESRQYWEEQGCTVLTEAQNSFVLTPNPPMDGVRTAEGGEGAAGEMAWAPLG